MLRNALLLCLFLAASVFADADGGWSLLTADFRQRPVSLVSIDPQGARIQLAGSDEVQQIPLDQFVQIDRVGPVRPGDSPFYLVMVSGDKLLGNPTGFKDEQVIWTSPVIGESSIPLKEIRALVRSGKWSESIERTRNDDLIQLANGDSAKGIVTDFADGKFKLSVDGTPVELPLANVDFVHFAAAIRPKAAAATLFRVRLSDSSVVTATTFQADSKEAFLTVAGAKRQVALSAIVGIEQLNGSVSWLSSRTPDQVVQQPFFSNPAWPDGARAWPTRMDASVNTARDGTPLPIRFGNRTYSRGIGVHAYSRLDYALDGTFKVFRTQYAIAPDDSPRAANVTVRIRLDGKTVHEREGFKVDILADPVTIDLPADAKLLTLEVDYGLHQDLQDRFNWIEPALLKIRPADPAPPSVAPSSQPATRPAP